MANTNPSQKSVHTKQIIYLTRHGVARHNCLEQVVNGSYVKPNLKDPRFTDSPLTPQGHEQPLKAGEVLRNHILEVYQQPIVIDGVIVSPLTRCLQTTQGMMKQIANYDDRQQPKIQVPRQWIAREELREAYGIHYSDKRSSKSHLLKEWDSHVDFQHLQSDEDIYWKADKRESIDDINQRIDKFLLFMCWNQLLRNIDTNRSNTDLRKESLCLVTSHGVWMECLFRRYFPNILQGGKRVYNCEVYRVEIESDWEHTQINNEWQCRCIQVTGVQLINGHRNT
ncbi:hypothetical protein CTEN210_02685 [Chaetoceros tenuissimus]|uniref:Phosphoglycerate mutase n=1 Tax=Chaetoceros tenuissimus TaxID=426638 RepID=A0AAD3CI03_9STRA|nr:hypothetical protein CTEN210_02685 [Chaetoceros tenuissimus]